MTFRFGSLRPPRNPAPNTAHLERVELHRKLPMEVLYLPAHDLSFAHFQLGQQLAPIIQRMARKRLRATKQETFVSQILTTRRTLQYLTDRSQDTLLHPIVRRTIHEYLIALSNWARGADLDNRLEKRRTPNNQLITGVELAMWLQDDNTGCQTGLVRRKDTSVLFWHTEEDTIGYFDKPRLACFELREGCWYTFLYPYLLPGPAFGWHNNYFQAIDSLSVQRDTSYRATYSSVASWIAWRLAGQVPTEEIIRAVLPTHDACAINTVMLQENKVTAHNHVYGAYSLITRALPTAAGQHLFQTNLMQDTKGSLAKLEDVKASERTKYCQRAERTAAALADANDPRDIEPTEVLQMLASKEGGSYAYANKDVKAHCVGVMSRSGLELYVAPDAAQRSDTYAPQFVPQVDD